MIKTRKSGFTLIELLVVIAIIALLLSIIVPSLRKAQTIAWEVICRSNLRQYGIAGTMYANDYEFFPNAWGSIYKSHGEGGVHRICQWHTPALGPIQRPNLAGSLWHYLGGQDKSHLCPVFERFAMTEYNCHTDGRVHEPTFSYSMNGFLGGFEYGSATDIANYKHVLRVRFSQIRSPSRIYFFGEENSWIIPGRYGATLNDNALVGAPQHTADAGAWTRSLDIEPGNPSAFLDSLGSFHRTTLDKKNDGESNVVFVDGSVDMVSWRETYRLGRWTDQQPTLH